MFHLKVKNVSPKSVSNKTLSIKFFLKPLKKIENSYVVHAQIRFNRTKAEFTTGIRCILEEWDELKEEFVNNSIFNQQLLDFKSNIFRIKYKLDESNISFTASDINKLIRYDKSDLNSILSTTIYMKDNPALVLSSDYVNTNKLFEDFNNIENIVNHIKSITGWNYIKSSNMFCDLLEAVKVYTSNISASKHLINGISEILNEKNVKKTTQYVFINDVLYPFVDGLKSQ